MNYYQDIANNPKPIVWDGFVSENWTTKLAGMKARDALREQDPEWIAKQETLKATAKAKEERRGYARKVFSILTEKQQNALKEFLWI